MVADREAAEFLNSIISMLYERVYDPARAAGRTSRLHIVDDPGEAAQMLSQPELFEKNFLLLSSFGNSRFNTNGEVWRVRRELSQKNYLDAARGDAISRVYKTYARALDAFEEPSFARLGAAFGQAAMEVFLAAHGCRADPQPFLDLLADLRAVLVELQYLSWNGADEARIERAKRSALTMKARFCEVALASPDTAALLTSWSEGIGKGGVEAAAEELLMNAFAGVETTTATLSWIVDRLGVNDRVQERIHGEATSDSGAATYAGCFANETLRFFPPIPFVTRAAAQETHLNGRRIDKGEQIVLSVIGVQHHPSVWSRPLEFESARAEFLENTYDRRAFIPFLSGPRTCGGARLAQIEILQGLKAFTERFVCRNPTADVIIDYSLAMRPGVNPKLSIERRS
jgi:cytochrome P450